MNAQKKNEVRVFAAALLQVFTLGIGLYGIRASDRSLIWCAIGLQCVVFLIAEVKMPHR